MAKQASEIMTTDVVSVSPETPVREVARRLLEHGISAVPVVDPSGVPLGMVSEGDLIGREDADREARRDWWLALVAEGEALSPDFLASFARNGRRARDVMAAPVVTVAPEASVREVARVLAEYRIKRVPVVREGRVVGIVSRADLLRALAEAGEAPAGPSEPHGILATLGERLIRHPRQATATGDRPLPGAARDTGVSADDFRHLVAGHEHDEAVHSAAERQAAVARQRAQVKALIDHHVEDRGWHAMLHAAREAAEQGETEHLLLRFPSALCSDGGRAVNAPEPDWPSTLRGEAAEIYLRWGRELKPHGFHLAARVLEFPDGFPGDIGLFLVWGK